MIFLAAKSDGGDGVLVFIGFNFSIGLTTVFLAAAWAVLGPGSYLRRLVWSHILAIVVALGYFAGLLAIVPENNFWNGSWTGLTPVTFFLAGIAPVSLAAQLPFWFFRLLFGWQFTLGSSPPAQSFSLLDIFVFTFVAALSFAGPQMASNQIKTATWFDPTSSYEEVTHPDGSTTWEEVLITDQQVIADRLREHNQQIRAGISSSYFAFAMYAFFFSLLSFPAVPFIFRPEETSIGCSLMFAYVSAWCILVTGSISVIATYLGGRMPPVEVFVNILFFVFVCGGLPSIFLAMSRSNGFRLTSPHRYRNENLVAMTERETFAKVEAASKEEAEEKQDEGKKDGTATSEGDVGEQNSAD